MEKREEGWWWVKGETTRRASGVNGRSKYPVGCSVTLPGRPSSRYRACSCSISLPLWRWRGEGAAEQGLSSLLSSPFYYLFS